MRTMLGHESFEETAYYLKLTAERFPYIKERMMESFPDLIREQLSMNTNSTDFACLVTGFLTDYLPHHRCYSRNTILSYRDTLKLFLRFLKEEKETSPNSFYIKDFKRDW